MLLICSVQLILNHCHILVQLSNVYVLHTHNLHVTGLELLAHNFILYAQKPVDSWNAAYSQLHSIMCLTHGYAVTPCVYPCSREETRQV